MTTRHFSARRLLTASGFVPKPRVAVDTDGFIRDIESGASEEREDTTLAPAFFDVHVHGAAGHDIMEGTGAAFASVGQCLATHGVARYLATTVTAPLDSTLRALDGIAAAIEAAERATSPSGIAQPVGIHLEGPFLSHSKRGVHPVSALMEPSLPLFERMWQAARGHIRLLTIAPEMPGALDLIRYVSGRGVRVSLGHSDATAAEARAGIAAGAVSATHTFNAMRRIDHREPGLAGVVLDTDVVYAELICDGIHVAPEFVRLWMLAKGRDKALLITDGISATGMPEGEYDLGGLTVAVKDGRCLLGSELLRGVETLAGSVLTMDRAVENLRKFTGVSLEVAIRAATRNPATMLGMPQLAEIAVGQPATFNVFGPDGELRETLVQGLSVTRTVDRYSAS